VLDTFELAEQGLKADTAAEKDIKKKYEEVNDELLMLLQGVGVLVCTCSGRCMCVYVCVFVCVFVYVCAYVQSELLVLLQGVIIYTCIRIVLIYTYIYIYIYMYTYI